MYEGLVEAALCCAWSADGRALACGGEAGELNLLAAPPQPTLLCQQLYAHDLGNIYLVFITGSLSNRKYFRNIN